MMIVIIIAGSIIVNVISILHVAAFVVAQKLEVEYINKFSFY